MTVIDDPSLVLPSPADIQDGFNDALEVWKPRNEMISKVDEMLMGQNKIPVPEDVSFVPRVTHTYLLQGAQAEKAARFSLLPIIAVVPANASPSTRAASTRIEMTLNGGQAQMEMRGDGDVWSRMVQDGLVYDAMVERIDRAPQAFWSDLTAFDPKDPNGREPLAEKFIRTFAERIAESAYKPFDSAENYKKYRNEYKQRAGLPLRTVHVPLATFFPRYDGPTAIECYQREQRTLRSVLSSKLFNPDALAILASRAGSLTTKQLLSTNVTILHYPNHVWHAYYALLPTSGASFKDMNGNIKWPDATASDMIGTPTLLHAYPHNIGRLTYNIGGGRNGGWKTQHNQIEAVMKGLCDLNQDADEYSSQVKTTQGELGWPTLVEEHDQDLRDVTGTGVPKPMAVKPGKPIAIWKTENIRPLFTPAPNPMMQWIYANTINQFERLSGSAAIYGQQDPGVRTGFHAHLQIAQSEHLDDKIEAHFVMAAINRGDIMLRHIKELNERVYVWQRFSDKKGMKSGRYTYIDPKDLDVMPELDAQVRKPRPVDFDAAVRAALNASQDRSGPGTPLYDDDTILEKFLGEQAPDLIKQKIAIQNEQRKLLQSGVLSKEIGTQVGLILAKESAPSVDPNATGQADPALLQALQGRMQQPVPGGVSPQVAQAVMQGAAAQGMPALPPGQPGLPPGPPNLGSVPPAPIGGPPPPSGIVGQGGGLPQGSAQPESTIGVWLRNAARAGGSNMPQGR